MTRVIRGVLEAPTVVRLNEAVGLPLNALVDVAITEPAAAGVPPEILPAADNPPEGSFLAVALRLGAEGPTDYPPDYSERWREYLAEEERKRNL